MFPSFVIALVSKNAKNGLNAEPGEDGDVTEKPRDSRPKVVDEANSALVAEMDADKDGHITPEELRKHLRHLDVQLDILHDRLDLETKMSQMMIKLPNFILCMASFVVGLYTLSPAQDIAAVNRQLTDFFGLHREDLEEVSTMDEIYDFILNFRDANDKMMSSSGSYWCESRYVKHVWDDEINAPRKVCSSPRLYALGYTENGKAWSEIYTGNMSATGPEDWPQEHTDCEDDNEGLQAAALMDYITCKAIASIICDVPAAFSYCKGTCGYCPPFEYVRVNEFVKPQKAILPIVVHQKRMKKSDCQGFAKVLHELEPNEALITSPTLDGTRTSDLVTCVDYNSEYDEEWDDHIKCPDVAADVDWCVDGEYQHTQKLEFMGHPVYPIMIEEKEREVNTMKLVDWLDVQTKEVSTSTLVYSHVNELFTLIVVTFKLDSAGHVQAEKYLLSARDLLDTESVQFIISMMIATITSVVGVLYPLMQVIRYKNCQNRRMAFELITRFGLGIYCIVLLVYWWQEEQTADMFEAVLDAFLMKEEHTHEANRALLKRYYSTLEIVQMRKEAMLAFRMIAYLLLYMQFMQLMMYFAFHPRMGILTATIAKASSALAHFFSLFSLLFCILGFMAHWMLGTHVYEFNTFANTVASQARMLFGEFIYADSANEISGTMTIMYWLYAFTFMLVVFFTLLNFFLAIIVDAFSEVKKDEKQDLTELDFANDCFDVLRCWWAYHRNKWPKRHVMMQKLKQRRRELQLDPKQGRAALERMENTEHVLQGVEEQRQIDKCSTAHFLALFPAFQNKDHLSGFLSFYFNKVPVILSKHPKPKTAPWSKDGKNEVGHKRTDSFMGTLSCDQDSDHASERPPSNTPLNEVVQQASSGSVPVWEDRLRDFILSTPLSTGPQAGDVRDWDQEALNFSRQMLAEVRRFLIDQGCSPDAVDHSSCLLDRITSMSSTTAPGMLAAGAVPFDRTRLLPPGLAGIDPYAAVKALKAPETTSLV